MGEETREERERRRTLGLLSAGWSNVFAMFSLARWVADTASWVLETPGEMEAVEKVVGVSIGGPGLDSEEPVALSLEIYRERVVPWRKNG